MGRAPWTDGLVVAGGGGAARLLPGGVVGQGRAGPRGELAGRGECDPGADPDRDVPPGGDRRRGPERALPGDPEGRPAADDPGPGLVGPHADAPGVGSAGGPTGCGAVLDPQGRCRALRRTPPAAAGVGRGASIRLGKG